MICCAILSSLSLSSPLLYYFFSCPFFFYIISILFVAESCLIQLAGLTTLRQFAPLAILVAFYLTTIGFQLFMIIYHIKNLISILENVQAYVP
jgi:hypothetical protein